MYLIYYNVYQNLIEKLDNKKINKKINLRMNTTSWRRVEKNGEKKLIIKYLKQTNSNTWFFKSSELLLV